MGLKLLSVMSEEETSGHEIQKEEEPYQKKLKNVKAVIFTLGLMTLPDQTDSPVLLQNHKCLHH